MNYSSIINGKNILITGGTGSFGYQIVKELRQYRPKKIIIFSRDENKQHIMKQELHDEKISKITTYVIGDVRDYSRLYTVCAGIDVVFHAAALKHVPKIEYNPFESIKTNVIGSQKVIDNSLKQNDEKDICGECDGIGILDGICDCNENVEDCLGVCGGDAVVDECGICDGDGGGCYVTLSLEDFDPIN